MVAYVSIETQIPHRVKRSAAHALPKKRNEQSYDQH